MTRLEKAVVLYLGGLVCVLCGGAAYMAPFPINVFFVLMLPAIATVFVLAARVE